LTSSALPVAVSGLSSGVTIIAAGGSTTCARTIAGAVLRWGDHQLGETTATSYGPLPAPVPGLSSNIAAISTSLAQSCVATPGEVLCWGWNNAGDLGKTGTQMWSPSPIAIPGLWAVAAISVGAFQTCVLTTLGGVLCWGYGALGDLGDGSTSGSLTPVAVEGLHSGVAAISSGGEHTCAVTTAGGLLCWGANGAGQLGNGSVTDSPVPVAVAGLSSGVAAVSAGWRSTCALTTSGGVLCWGSNEFGQLGNGTVKDSHVPVPVVGLSTGVSAVSVGIGGHACAVTTQGGVVCWGDNTFGQLGDGTTGTSRPAPVAVVDL
jgi:alpha-tubulin suppressor-like RCC1 family protein